jgi:hypothetical protein
VCANNGVVYLQQDWTIFIAAGLLLPLLMINAEAGNRRYSTAQLIDNIAKYKTILGVAL